MSTLGLMLTGIKSSFCDLGVTRETANGIDGKINVPVFIALPSYGLTERMFSLYSWKKTLKMSDGYKNDKTSFGLGIVIP